MVEIEVDNVWLNFKKNYYEYPKSRQKCVSVKQIAVIVGQRGYLSDALGMMQNIGISHNFQKWWGRRMSDMYYFVKSSIYKATNPNWH